MLEKEILTPSPAYITGLFNVTAVQQMQPLPEHNQGKGRKPVTTVLPENAYQYGIIFGHRRACGINLQHMRITCQISYGT